MPDSDPLSLSLICNAEAIAVNQHSSNNRQVSRHERSASWIADAAENGDKYLALFNLQETPQVIPFDFSLAELGGPHHVRDLWAGRDLGEYQDSFAATIAPHGAGLYRVKPAV